MVLPTRISGTDEYAALASLRSTPSIFLTLYEAGCEEEMDTMLAEAGIWPELQTFLAMA